MRKHVTWVDREEKDLDGQSRQGVSIPGSGNDASKGMEAGGWPTRGMTRDWENVRGETSQSGWHKKDLECSLGM